ncbi:glycosyltransferase [Streptococcus sp. DD12]|uniref:glycosyltransferase n=1 Tax=Streptococcus sp. DD12 TaxID=1777880 RepID=UPI00079C1139|nr:glycosyltransferase [Streptococcus sp. DD12]KXT76959.1 Glycosyl transferase CpsG [Streptococcus sp. DD12]
MIFVTVGTHEQGFDRLVEAVDRLKLEGTITDDVFIQTGYTRYTPKACRWQAFLSYDEMQEALSTADRVITHGGPASFMAVIAMGKCPLVVPRLKAEGEHVNDHQKEFLEKIEGKVPLVPIYHIADLAKQLSHSPQEQGASAISSHTDAFVSDLEKAIHQLLKEKKSCQ